MVRMCGACGGAYLSLAGRLQGSVGGAHTRRGGHKIHPSTASAPSAAPSWQELDLHYVHGELTLGRMQLTHLAFSGSQVGAHPSLTVGWAELAEPDEGGSTAVEAMEQDGNEAEAGGPGTPGGQAPPPGLRSLSLSSAHLAPANCSAASLRQLAHLRVGLGGLSEALLAALPTLPGLTSLALDPPLSPLGLEMQPAAQETMLSRAAASCRHLRELSLRGLAGLRGLALPPDALTKLTKLALADVHLANRPNHAWQLPACIPDAAPSLEVLDLTGCSLVSLRQGAIEVLSQLAFLRRVLLPRALPGGHQGPVVQISPAVVARLRRELPQVQIVL